MNLSSANTGLPAEIASRLRQLRQQISRWVLVHGLSRWAIAVVCILVVDMAADRLFKMDFAQRMIMLLGMLGFAVIYLFIRVLRPMRYQTGDDALLHELEAQDQGLREELISGAQLARQTDQKQRGISRDLVEATIRKSVEHAENLNTSEILNRAGFASNLGLLVAAAILFCLIGAGATQPGFLQTWFNRNILLGSDQWPQATYLQIVGANEGQLQLPRGINHRQLVMVTADSSVQDVEVQLEIDGPSGRFVHDMDSTGGSEGREHAFTIHNVGAEFRMRATGGDDVTEWVTVSLVEPPRLESLSLTLVLPEYTEQAPQSLIGPGPHPVLKTGQIQVRAIANKPLAKCQVLFGESEIELDSTDGLNFELTLPSPGERLLGGDYEIDLADENDLAAVSKNKFSIRTVDDQVPKLGADLLGIGGLVVPQARIPIEFGCTDDFGLSKLFFDAGWKNSDEDVEGAENQLKQDIWIAKMGEAPHRRLESVGVLDLLPLNLEPGTNLVLNVVAMDNCPAPPGLKRSKEFLLRIVTPQELRGDLLRREIEQRKAFQQKYDAQMRLSAELRAIAAMRPATNQELQEFRENREDKILELMQLQKTIGTDIASVAERYEEFLVEVQNNRLDDALMKKLGGDSLEVRYAERIIEPIRRLDEGAISIASSNLDSCLRLVGNQQELGEAVNRTTELHVAIMQTMKEILDAMVDSEQFQDLVNGVLDIKDGQQEIKSKIDTPDVKEVFDDIFDDN